MTMSAQSLWRCVLVVGCLLNGTILVFGLPSLTAETVTPVKSRDSLLLNNTRENNISPPHGFSCRFRRIAQGRAVSSRDLYSVTLHALLHYSLQTYVAPAEWYSTRGAEPLGEVVLKAVPFVLPVATTLNAHLIWGLYRSIIAYNIPDNIRETLASIYIEGLQVADIEYLKLAPTPIVTNQGPGNVTALTSATALQMLSAMGDASNAKEQVMVGTNRFRLRFVLETNGQEIRRETAYDTIAYAILWTSQYSESTPLTGVRVLSVPGGGSVVRFVSYQAAMTLGFAATVTRSIPTMLENAGRFQEAFMLVQDEEGQVCGVIGIWNERSRSQALSSITSE
ncbi:MAG: hypothetical protein LQ348_004119 [Seirophora lacunosa]|nr:MAG: hypothetical protein LQ348_004119 [Seirophora lacunosa]